MKKRNKTLALLLAMTMCGTALAGCGSEVKTSEATSSVSTETVRASTETTATESVATEPLKNVDIYPLDSDKTFTVVSPANIFSENSSTVITEAMEKATGVSIEWTYMAKEQLQLAVTSKEFPDAIFMNADKVLDKATVYEYGSAGYFVNFMDYIDIMPNFAAAIEANPDMLDAVQNEDGSVYCLPQRLVTNTSANNLIYYRTDMMKEIGWEKAPETTDEFIQYIKDLQAYYGANDPDYIAYNAYNGARMEWNSVTAGFFFPSFGALLTTELTTDSNGKVVLGAATEQYRYYLEFMNEVWNSGAFNTNIYTQEATASQALNAGNHVGVCTVHNGHSMDCFEGDEFALEIMAPLTSEYWDTQQWYQKAATIWDRVTVLSADCEDVETMVKWFDAWYSTKENPLNEEGTFFGITPWLGEIGVDYVMDDETMIYTEQEHEGIGTGTFLATQSFQVALYSGYEGGLFPYSQAPTSGVGVKGRGTTNNLWPYGVTPEFQTSLLTLTQDETDIYNDAWADINGFISERTAKFITGELSIEQEWDNYLNSLEQMGLQDVIDAYQAAYDRYQAN